VQASCDQGRGLLDVKKTRYSGPIVERFTRESNLGSETSVEEIPETGLQARRVALPNVTRSLGLALFERLVECLRCCFFAQRRLPQEMIRWVVRIAAE
jgi:hypothetical protein